MERTTHVGVGSAGEQLTHARLFRWLVLALVLGWAIAWVLIWVQGSFLGRDVFGVISYKGADQPVVDPPYRIGVHTFGDYLEPWRWVQQPNPWTDIDPAPNYPPVAMALFEPFGLLPPRDGLIPYLALLVVALMVPAVWATWRSSWPVRVAMISAFMLSAPVTVALDRGNQVALLVPFLLVFTLGVARGRDRSAVIGLGGAVCMKAYPALIAVALLWRRPVRNGAIAAALAATLSALVWALYPGSVSSNLRAWLASVVGFSRDDRADPLLPGYNYSLTGGLQLLFNETSQVGALLADHPWVPGITFMMLTSLVVFRQARPSLIGFSLVLASTQLVVPVSAHYTIVFALVPFAILLHDALQDGPERLLALPQGPNERVRLVVWVLAMALTLVPLPFMLRGVVITPALLALTWILLLALECLPERAADPDALAVAGL